MMNVVIFFISFDFVDHVRYQLDKRMKYVLILSIMSLTDTEMSKLFTLWITLSTE